MSKQSPPFRDSDAIQIVIKRLELIADLMRRMDYGPELERNLTEVGTWLSWLSECIEERADAES